MPRQDVAKYEIHFVCDHCGESEHFNSEIPDSELVPAMAKWKSCRNQNEVPTQQNDPHRYYDSVECMTAGENRHDEEIAKAVQDAISEQKAMAKVNETMKNSGMMDKALKLVQA